MPRIMRCIPPLRLTFSPFSASAGAFKQPVNVGYLHTTAIRLRFFASRLSGLESGALPSSVDQNTHALELAV